MSNYRRSYLGLTYFFTVVTYKRRQILMEDLARKCLRKVWLGAEKEYPFEVLALSLMPNHLHCIWRLPQDDVNYSRRWGLIKKNFSRLYLAQGGQEMSQSESRSRKREHGIWQRRFYEHRIRDEKDMRNHMNYVHYNPAKHGYVENPFDWPWSTIHRYYPEGRHYEQDWDAIVNLDIDSNIEYDLD